MSENNPEKEKNSKTHPSLQEINEYDRYLNERKLLVEGEATMAKSFDNAILTLAGGIFAISLTFIREIAPQRLESWILYISWPCLLLAILSTTFSYILSMQAFRKQRKILSQDYTNNKITTNTWTIATQWVNIVSMLLFFIGGITLAIFMLINISN